jgi:hypothetical protein
VIERGEGYIGREITLRVEKTIWTREAAPEAAPESFTTFGQGWWMHGGKRFRFQFSDAPRMEVGQRFLVPLVKADEGAWTVLNYNAAHELDGEQTVPIPQGQRGHNNLPASRAVEGKTILEIAQLLANTRVDPLAAKYQHLGPDARLDAVLRDQGSTG